MTAVIPEKQWCETANVYKKIQTPGLPKVEALIYHMEKVLGQLNKAC